MKLTTLVLCEIRHRFASFVLTVLSVTVAIAAFVCSYYLLRTDALKTEQLLSVRQQEVEDTGSIT